MVDKNILAMEATAIRIAVEEAFTFIAVEFVNLDSTEDTLTYFVKGNWSMLETIDLDIAEDYYSH